jgi:hypothetical protein
VSSIAVPSFRNGRDAQRFVLELDRRLEPLDRAILVADWNLNTGRSRRGPGPWQLKRAELLSDPRLLPWVRGALQESWPPLLRRRLELLERILLDTSVEQHPEVVRLREELQRAIVQFRPMWNGRRVNRAVIGHIVRRDRDPSHRRQAFYALQPLYRPLEEPFLRLVRLRNERARAQGFATFAEMRLGFQGFSSARVVELAETAVQGVRRRALALRDQLPSEGAAGGWHPWDLPYARERLASIPDRALPQRGMLPRVLRGVEKWGFPTSRMRFRVVFHDLPAGGLTLAPDPPSDVRILVHPRGGWGAYQAMFHEVGHAVHSASIRSPRHLLRWHENIPGFGGMHEGIGGLFEEIPRERAWLVEAAGISPAAAERFAEARRDTDLIGTASISSWILPELNLYRQPGRDPMASAQRFARRTFGYDAFAPTSFVDSFYVVDPLYTANYLLATMFHYQLAASLRARFGEPLWPNRKVGPCLTREWFAPGSLIDWVPHLQEVTGKPFGAQAFCEWFRQH